jgi:RNA polymerase primary sigma factor
LSAVVLEQITLTVQETLTLEYLRTFLDRSLIELTPREEKILKLRYGLWDGRKHTIPDVATYFDLSQSRIRQITDAAIRKLRSWLLREIREIKCKESAGS